MNYYEKIKAVSNSNLFEIILDDLKPEDIKYNTYLTVKCLRCNRIFNVLASSVVQKGKFTCINCDHPRKKSDIDVKLEILQKANLLLLDPYKGTNTNHRFLCLECFRIKVFKPNKILSEGRRCNHKDSKNKKFISTIQTLYKKNKDLLDEKSLEILDSKEMFATNGTPIRFKCNICNSNFTSTMKDLIKRGGCPVCLKKQKDSNIDESKKKELELKILSSPKIKYYDYLGFEKDRYTKSLYTRKDTIKLRHKICGSICYTSIDNFLNENKNHCIKCRYKDSSFEVQFKQFLDKELGLVESKDYIKKYRDKNSNYEIDFFFKDKNIGIELNGDYWHSESIGRGRNYHKDKLEVFEKQGINLIQIFLEYHWNSNAEIVKNIIKHKLGLIDNKIYGRNCVVSEIDHSTAKDFLDKCHLFGGSRIGSIRYALYDKKDIDKKDILAVCTFTKTKDHVYEITRFANKLNTTVIGGYSKLVKHFLKEYKDNIKTLFTYADRNFSYINNVYDKMGIFNIKMITRPSYYYFKNNVCYSRQKFMKSKLKSFLEVYDENLTEYENAIINGYHRIWNCGNIKYIYNKL